MQAKTRDLSEALTYQTGSANILNVIASSPTDIEPVLNAIVEGACELCEANDAAVLLKDGEHLRFRAHHGPIDINLEKWPITRGWTAGRAFLDGKPVHLRDTQSEEAKEFPDSRALAVPPYTNFSVRTVLSVPLLRESERVGAILLRRIEMRPFSDKQIALLQTFADQAVIAINNARLFDEVQAKTRDLTESLQQQTATADVLKVISRSAFDLQMVLDTLVESAARLCDADYAMIFRGEGDTFKLAATTASQVNIASGCSARSSSDDEAPLSVELYSTERWFIFRMRSSIRTTPGVNPSNAVAFVRCWAYPCCVKARQLG